LVGGWCAEKDPTALGQKTTRDELHSGRKKKVNFGWADRRVKKTEEERHHGIDFWNSRVGLVAKDGPWGSLPNRGKEHQKEKQGQQKHSGKTRSCVEIWKNLGANLTYRGVMAGKPAA